MKTRIISQTKKKGQTRRKADEATEPKAGGVKKDGKPAIKPTPKNSNAQKPKSATPKPKLPSATAPKSGDYKPDSGGYLRSKAKRILEYVAELAKKAQQAYQSTRAGRSKADSSEYNILAWKVGNVIYAQLLPKIGEAEEHYYASIFYRVNEKSEQEIPFVLDNFKDVPPKVAIKNVLLALVDDDKAVLDSCIKDNGVLHIEGLDTYSGQ